MRPMHKAPLLILMFLCTLPLFAQEVGCAYQMKASQQAKFDQAVGLFAKKRYAECAAQLRKIAAKEPKSPDVCFYQGLVAAKQGENPGAIRRYFTKLYSLCPDYPNALAHFYLGVVHYSDDLFDEAVADFNRFFEIANQNGNPDYDAVYQEASNYLYWSQFLAESYRNKAPFDPKVVLGVSSRHDEFLPYLTLDGKEFYYVRMVPEDDAPTFYERELEKKVAKLLVSRRKDTTFTEGDLLPEPFNVNKGEGSITMTADNKTLYYSVQQPSRNGYSNVDIYFTHCVNGYWQPIQNAGSNVNGEKYWDSQPSITPDGQYLYFASNRPGGMGGTDIWRCRRLPNGDWSRAENLGSSVNSPRNEKCPFIHADGHTLYFASNGWQGFGGYDMYFIDLCDSAIQCPTNLGLPINTDNDDICFGVTTDGSKAYFSGRPVNAPTVGGNDVYLFDLYPAARPEPMALVKGKMMNSEGMKLNGTITVERQGLPPSSYCPDTTDGSFAVVVAQKEDNVISLESEGYFPSVCVVRGGRAASDVGRLLANCTLQPVMPKGRYHVPVSPRNGPLTDVDKQVLDVYVRFLLSHPRLHVCVASPSKDAAEKAYQYFLSSKLRPERISFRSGTDVGSMQLIVTSE